MKQGCPLKHELIFSAMAGSAGDRFSISPFNADFVAIFLVSSSQYRAIPEQTTA